MSTAALFFVLACSTLHAQDAAAQADTVLQPVPQGDAGGQQAQRLAAELPVARLSRLAGPVTAQAEDGTSAAVDAALNMPLPAGERLSTGENGEAEMEFADGSVLRITPRSEAVLERIDPESHATSLRLGNGLFYLELRASDRSVYSVGAADLLLTPDQNSSFRVRVQDAQVEVAMFAGSLSIVRPNAYTATLQAGESLHTDPKNGRRYLLADTVSPDPWDSWNERLAQAAQDEQAARTSAREGYAGDQAYGWADLDANGSWYTVPGEGEVWQPALADAGFDPYANGAWVYGPGGYAWASGYAWGWLPYRCGAWTFYAGFGWGWLPAGSCVNFGFGGGQGGFPGGGGFRVQRPPVWWHGPRRPPSDGGLQGTPHRHPTVPVRGRPLQVADATPAASHKPGEVVRIAGAVATPLKRLGPQLGPAVAGSAVGSALLRDYPVRRGTHEPVLGVQPQTGSALPTRMAEWRRVQPAIEPTSTAPVGPASGAAFTAGALRQTNSSAAPPGTAPGRIPLPTDPPLGATGAPPFGANGPPPFGTAGRPVPAAESMHPLRSPLQPRVLVPGPAIAPVAPRTVPPSSTVHFAPPSAPAAPHSVPAPVVPTSPARPR